jgi:hypothetical protein
MAVHLEPFGSDFPLAATLLSSPSRLCNGVWHREMSEPESRAAFGVAVVRTAANSCLTP